MESPSLAYGQPDTPLMTAAEPEPLRVRAAGGAEGHLGLVSATNHSSAPPQGYAARFFSQTQNKLDDPGSTWASTLTTIQPIRSFGKITVCPEKAGGPKSTCITDMHALLVKDR